VLTDAQALVASAALTWAMLITASSMRSRLWTLSGARVAVGNRDNVPKPSPAAERADRAAKNMLENLALFVALMVAASFAGRTGGRVTLGANVFVWARVVYWAVYVAGVPYLRTAVWSTGVLGLAAIGSSLF
jgi:uncharacterized MAPEG superfamily protein